MKKTHTKTKRGENFQKESRQFIGFSYSVLHYTYHLHRVLLNDWYQENERVIFDKIKAVQGQQSVTFEPTL